MKNMRILGFTVALLLAFSLFVTGCASGPSNKKACEYEGGGEQLVFTIDGLEEYSGKFVLVALSKGNNSGATVGWGSRTISSNSETLRILCWTHDNAFCKSGTYGLIINVSESSAKGSPDLYTGHINSLQIKNGTSAFKLSDFDKL